MLKCEKECEVGKHRDGQLTLGVAPYRRLAAADPADVGKQWGASPFCQERRPPQRHAEAT